MTHRPTVHSKNTRCRRIFIPSVRQSLRASWWMRAQLLGVQSAGTAARTVKPSHLGCEPEPVSFKSSRRFCIGWWSRAGRCQSAGLMPLRTPSSSSASSSTSSRNKKKTAWNEDVSLRRRDTEEDDDDGGMMREGGRGGGRRRMRSDVYFAIRRFLWCLRAALASSHRRCPGCDPQLVRPSVPVRIADRASILPL